MVKNNDKATGVNRRDLLTGSAKLATMAGLLGGAGGLMAGSKSAAAASGNKWKSAPVNWTNITGSFPAARPARFVSLVCRRCAS